MIDNLFERGRTLERLCFVLSRFRTYYSSVSISGRSSFLLSLFIVITLATAIRTFDYRNTSLDYDEHKTIVDELPLMNREHIAGYFTLRNVWNYDHVNKNYIGINNSICFPLYYIPMRLVHWFRPELSAIRLATIVWGICTVALFYVLGRVYGRSVAWLGSILMLFHPWVHHHTVHIRFYECWALISILGLLFAERIIRKLKNRNCSLFDCWVYAGVVMLPGTVHAFGVVNSLFIMTYTALQLRFNRVHLARSQWITLIVSFVIIGIVVSANVGAFGYATLIEGQAEGWNNSTSITQIVGSFVFNLGYMLPVLILTGLIVVKGRRVADRFHNLFHLTIALTVSLVPVAAIVMFAPNVFRADFLYGVLPYIILAGALSIDAISSMYFRDAGAQSARILMVFVAVVSTLPTFVSNVLIDKDRLPHQLASAEIATRPEGKVFAPNPNYFNYYLGDRRVVDIRKANQNFNDSGTDEYFYIPVRKGMATHMFYDFRLIDGINLLEIIGKDRIDLRSNQIYVFIRRAGGSDATIAERSDP